MNASYVIDLLEESIAFQRPVAIGLRQGFRFVDQVREIVTELDEEWAVFDAHGRIRVNDIAGCSRIEPFTTTTRDTA